MWTPRKRRKQVFDAVKHCTTVGKNGMCMVQWKSVDLEKFYWFCEEKSSKLQLKSRHISCALSSSPPSRSARAVSWAVGGDGNWGGSRLTLETFRGLTTTKKREPPRLALNSLESYVSKFQPVSKLWDENSFKNSLQELQLARELSKIRFPSKVFNLSYCKRKQKFATLIFD